MKFFMHLLIFVLVALQCVQGDSQQKMKQAILACKTSTGVSNENILKLRKGERVEDAKIQEYSLCTLKQTGFMNEEGHLQVDVIKAKLTSQYGNEEEAGNVVKKCAVEKETPQVTAYETILCGYRVRKNNIKL